MRKTVDLAMRAAFESEAAAQQLMKFDFTLFGLGKVDVLERTYLDPVTESAWRIWLGAMLTAPERALRDSYRVNEGDLNGGDRDARRVTFERWAIADGYSVVRSTKQSRLVKDSYVDLATSNAWAGWWAHDWLCQMAPAGEPVAEVVKENGEFVFRWLIDLSVPREFKLYRAPVGVAKSEDLTAAISPEGVEELVAQVACARGLDQKKPSDFDALLHAVVKEMLVRMQPGLPAGDRQALEEFRDILAGARSTREPTVGASASPTGNQRPRWMGNHTELPWKITEADGKRTREIVGANGQIVAKLTALDIPNAELIVASVNAAHQKYGDVVSTLVTAAEAVVSRWHSPKWKDQPHTGEFIRRLETAAAAVVEVAPPAQSDSSHTQPFGAGVGRDATPDAPF